MKCSKCTGRSGLTAIGKCSGCGSMISSMTDKFCAQCSSTRQVCQGCGCSLTPAPDSSAPASDPADNSNASK